jgi:maleate isomerase
MKRALIGILTPSSNTILEPTTSAILSGIEEASAHFSRFTVTRIALSGGANAQFEFEPMIAAARLLADARMGVIGWSGTSASWLGFERDQTLCDLITRATGITACTSVLALNELLAARSIRRFALVSPYTPDVQDAIIANYAKAGLTVVAEAHAGIAENYAFSEIGDDEVRRMCRAVARDGAEAIVIMCTNMRGARLAEELEAELGIPLLDSTAAVVWKALKLLAIDTRRAQGWGRMFSEAA